MATVYRFIFPDGYWYIGHTTGPLSRRLRHHERKGTQLVRERFEKFGRPETEVLAAGLTTDEAKEKELDLLQEAEAHGDWVHSLNVRTDY